VPCDLTAPLPRDGREVSGVDEARNDIHPAVTESGFSLTVKRNCSISPQALAVLLALTAGFAFAIGIAFALYGAWPILPFAGLEIAALAAAFYLNGRHAADYERIAPEGGCWWSKCATASVATHRLQPAGAARAETRRDVRLRCARRAGTRDRAPPDAPGRERLARKCAAVAQARTARIQSQTGSR
jgi:uncharacterized membrane protein